MVNIRVNPNPVYNYDNTALYVHFKYDHDAL